MWIYSFEIPILMILGIILLFYFSRTRLPLRRNRVFLKLILIETVIILLDVSASVIDNDFREYPLICINIINMCYFIVFFMRAYVLYAFTVSVMIFDPEKSLFFRRLARIPMYLGIILAVLSMILGSRGYHNLIYYIDNDGYHSGAGYYVLYVVGFFYVILCFVASHLFYWNNRSGRREKYGMLLYNLLILSALIIRLLFPTVLIMDTMVFMAILVVFLAFINPEYYLDLRAFCFNSYALSEHIAENIGHLRMAPLGIVIRNFSEMRNIYGSEQMEEGLSLISMYFKELFPKGYVFYNRNGHFIILDDPQTDFEEKTRILSERFDRPWVSENTVLYLTAGFAIFEMAKDNHSSEALVSTLMRSLKKVDDLGSKETLYVTDDDIVKTEEENRVRRSIEDAIDGNGLELYLQPIYDAITGKLAGSEALSRIRDNEGNIIPPGIFIPVAESSRKYNPSRYFYTCCGKQRTYQCFGRDGLREDM